ncbi:MAG: hypothetical protein QXJ17_02630 [Nitrososphaeria archaeon]
MQVKSIEGLLLEIYLKLPYIEGISEVRGVDRRRAIKLAQKNNASRTGSDVKDVFRTLDSKNLLRDILKLLTPFCGSRVTQDRVLAMTPYSDPEALRARIDSMEQFFKFADSNQSLIKEAREILRSSSIGKVGRALDPLVVVGNEELRNLVTCSARNIRVQVLSKKGLVESLKREQLVICVGFGEVKDAVSLPESFELFDVVPDRFVGVFESFKKVLEAYVRASKLLEGSQLGGLFKNWNCAVKISSLVSSLKLNSLDPSKSLEEAEIKISEGIDRIRRSGGDSEEFRSIVQEAVESLGIQIGLDGKTTQALVKDALENARSPFSFSTYLTKRLIEEFRRKTLESSYREYRRVAFELSKYVEDLAQIAEELYEFDLMLAIYEFSKVYSLSFPRIIEEGIGFIGGKNILLLEDELRGGLKVQKVDYSIGKTGLEIFGATTRNIVLLTGANSGGKTTLLMTVAQIATMSLLGLPVPAEEAEVSLSSIYLYRRRTVKKTGSLEHALRSTIPILSKRERKLVLMDEFEALTEPKAIARIMAAFLNNMPKHSLALFVTHLAGDIIPYLRSEYRVDGIEATGVDSKGNLIVNRQPTFNKLGTSSPELIVEKLQKTTKRKNVARAYSEMLKLLNDLRTGRVK